MVEEVVGFVVAVNEESHTGVKIAESMKSKGDWFNGSPNDLRPFVRGDRVKITYEERTSKDGNIKNIVQGISLFNPVYEKANATPAINVYNSAPAPIAHLDTQDLIIRQTAMKCACSLLGGSGKASMRVVEETAGEIVRWIKRID
jgi:hypothetical protein